MVILYTILAVAELNRVMSNGEYYSDLNARLRRRYKPELAAWIGGLGFNVGLTLNVNRQTGLMAARAQVGKLFFRVDRKLFGTKFAERPERRTQGVFFFEHVETNIHCHGLLAIRPECHDRFMSMFPVDGRGGPWSKVCPSGTHCVRIGNIEAAARYDTKEQTPWSAPATMVWLAEFHPQQ